MQLLVASVRRLLVFLLVILITWQLGSWCYLQMKAVFAHYLLTRAWSKTLEGQTRVKPWSWADTWPVARMQVAQHGINLVVLAGDSPRNLAFSPAQRLGSADIGTQGQTMISAHRDTHFRFLQHVRQGDAINMQDIQGKWHQYHITSMHIVDARNATLPITSNQSQLTLVTCYPFNAIVSGGPLRYVVIASKIE